MSEDHLVYRAFENIAAHIVNLSCIKELIEQLFSKTQTLEEFIFQLESEIEGAEVTLKTDIRILLNEIRALARRN